MKAITSVNNPRIKDLVRLQKSGAERRLRRRFCIEHQRELQRALDAGFRLVEFYFTASTTDDALIRRASAGGCDVVEVSEPVIAKISYRQNPTGFVAVFESRTLSLDELTIADDALLLVCSGLEKPGNIGAILRSADAAGVDLILIDSPDFDVFNPNCIRASTGAAFTVPIVCDERESIIARLQSAGCKIFAATPDGELTPDNSPLHERPLALIVGAEDQGLNEAWRTAADARVRLPMRGSIDSLNVSVTAALLLFEAARRRP